jgi:carbamate kinase
VAIGHGNGPQVGFILRRSEIAAKVEGMHEVPLDACGADSQGAIGYALQQNLQNDLYRRGIRKSVATVVTQVLVDKDDQAFKNPSKPIGSFMDEAEAKRREKEGGWNVVEDAGRGWRRVVPSPLPKEVVELQAVETLLKAGTVVITVGGGGIPVVRDEAGLLRGVAAVIDKDYASSLLATSIAADTFVISTAVERVALDWGGPAQRWIDRMTLEEARRYLAEGIHFAPGSMAPKIEACIGFLERGGGEAVISSPENLELALAGKAGTHIVRS